MNHRANLPTYPHTHASRIHRATAMPQIPDLARNYLYRRQDATATAAGGALPLCLRLWESSRAREAARARAAATASSQARSRSARPCGKLVGGGEGDEEVRLAQRGVPCAEQQPQHLRSSPNSAAARTQRNLELQQHHQM
eukprot:scaffold21476_cov27-Phaeocystis_antarctica.AAC.1